MTYEDPIAAPITSRCGEQMDTYADARNEPPLREVLDDPIVKSVMARDNVARADLERLIETYRGNRAADRMAADRPASGLAGRIMLWAGSLVRSATLLHG
jgi:hypothetical protein